MEKIKEIFKNSLFWTISITILAIVLGVIYPLCFVDNVTFSDLSSWVGTIISGVAFLWLIYGFFIQKEVIKSQRKEFVKLIRFNALQQIYATLDSFNEKLRNSENVKLNSIDDIQPEFMQIFSFSIENITKDDCDEREKWNTIKKWGDIKQICNEFLGVFVSLSKLYFESVDESLSIIKDDLSFDFIKDKGLSKKINIILDSIQENKNAWFIKSNISKLEKIPLLASTLKKASNLADIMIMLEPGMDKIELAILEMNSKYVKDGVLEKLRKKVAAYDEFVANKKINSLSIKSE